MKVKIEDSCIACGFCEQTCDAVFSVEDIVETLTTGLSELPNVIKAFKEFHYLAVKDNYKLEL